MRFLFFHLFPNIPDQVLEKNPAFPAALACAGRVHDRLQGVRAAADGVLDHAVGFVDNQFPPIFESG